MNVFQILRFFLPGENPLGFSLPDAIELFVAALGLAAILLRRRIGVAANWLAARPRAVMALLIALPGLLRLGLLRQHPAPIPTVPDDFSFLLLADTLAHFRLANPVHPMHRFFESLFVLQEPSYSSIYPPGQGMALALGQVVFGHPWAGVLLSAGIFCGLCFWMLRAWVAPVWAVAGGFIAVVVFGPLHKWTNDYWGGAVSAIAGCLVFGALPRLRRQTTARDAILLGTGLGIQWLSRPFESLLLFGTAGAFLLAMLPRGRRLGWMLLPIAAAGGLTLLHNRAVTGDWTTLPYIASRAQYGVPATFVFQPNARASRLLTQEQQTALQAERDAHDHPTPWSDRLGQMNYFLFPALFAAVPFALDRRWLWAWATIAGFFAGTAFYPYFYAHYIAAVACLFILLAVAGLERMSRIRLAGFDAGVEAAAVVLILAAAHFAFWYGLHIAGNPALFQATRQYEMPDYVNYGDAEGRRAIARRLAEMPEPQLVFVRYSPGHTVREWIHNPADIDQARVVWALDSGPEQNAALRLYYPKRRAWLLEPDLNPPRLMPLSGQ